MYKRVKTQKNACLQNGANIEPIATLKDEYGGVAHIGTDDHCYMLYLERTEALTSDSDEVTFCKPTPYIFREAFNILKTLPEPN